MAKRTRTLPLDPHHPDPAVVAEAAEILRNGGLVAFATETVYGLGADATNPSAVARIFEAKGRPANNPLIVHADAPEMAASCVEGFDTEATAPWWPGPVTFVFRPSPLIPDVVTAGGATVGVRVPRPESARALIRALGRPVAAPSANRSTRVSPTTAGHVLEGLDGQIDLILDGGPTEVGIESTVVDMTGPTPKILRPGPVTLGRLLGRTGLEPDPIVAESSIKAALSSPGQQRVHYAPGTPAYWVERSRTDAVAREGRGAWLVVGHDLPASAVALDFRLSLPGPVEAARDLYSALHSLDGMSFDFLCVAPPEDSPEWAAVRDRLWRATRPLD